MNFYFFCKIPIYTIIYILVYNTVKNERYNMKNQLFKIFILILIILNILCSFTACNFNSSNIKNCKGFYVSFTDNRSVIAADIKDKNEIEKMYEKVKASYIYGYNFTFLYIKEDGSFYHYFSAKDDISQETIGTINISGKTLNFKGETEIIKKNNESITTPFSATMKNISTEDDIVLLMQELEQSHNLERIYGATGYKKIKNIDEMMFLTFESINQYNKNASNNKSLNNFPELVNLFNEANEKIKTWTSLDIKTGFYAPTDNDNAFIFIDKDKERFIYYEENKITYDGKYSLEGKNMIVYDFNNKEFIPFIILPDSKFAAIKSFKSIEGRLFNYYPKLDYLTKLNISIINSIKDYPFTSSLLRKLLSELELQ